MSSDQGGEAGEPIGPEDLPRLFADAAASRARGAGPPLLGVEVEWLPVDPASGGARPYAGPGGVAELFARLLREGFADAGGAGAGGAPTLLRRGALTIGLEPGGQVELSGSPVPSLHDAAREIDEASEALALAAERAGLWLVAHGVQPLSVAADIAPVPKRRYGYMVEHFAAHGGARYLDMMRLTASVQVSFDYASEVDAGRKLRAAALLAPVVTALTAGSPLLGGRPTGRQSERAAIWQDTDRARTGALAAALEEPFRFERLAAEVAAIPAILRRAADGGVAAAGSRPFAALLAEGRAAGRPLTRADWELHLSTVFTDARLKRVVECRAADAPPPGATLAPAALYTGILYGDAAHALDGALALLAPLGAVEALAEASREAALRGLAGRAFGAASFREVGREVLALAERGLAARGLGEEGYLGPLLDVVESGESFADRALAEFAAGGALALARAGRLR